MSGEHLRTGLLPKSILHIISSLPVGGVENQLLLVLKNYDRTKFRPTVCSLSDEGEVGKKIRDMGIEVVCLNKLGHGFQLAIVKDLMDLMRQRDIQVVRTHQYHANLYGRLAAWLCRIPCIIPSVHNIYTRDRKFHRRVLNNLLARVSDRVVAVSETVKADIARYDRLPEDKITVIHNGMDKQSFLNANGKAVRSELGIAAEADVIGTVGRLTPQKGQKYILKAMSGAVRKLPRLILVIVGDGPAKEELMQYAADLGIAEHVIFTGSRKDVPALLAAMDVFVFPSLWEGLPNALIEAMAAGKPIIASDIPPAREVLASGKCGIFVPVSDAEGIRAALEYVLHDAKIAEALGQAAQERALSDFDITSTIDRYEDLFEGVLAGKGRW